MEEYPPKPGMLVIMLLAGRVPKSDQRFRLEDGFRFTGAPSTQAGSQASRRPFAGAVSQSTLLIPGGGSSLLRLDGGRSCGSGGGRLPVCKCSDYPSPILRDARTTRLSL